VTTTNNQDDLPEPKTSDSDFSDDDTTNESENQTATTTNNQDDLPESKTQNTTTSSQDYLPVTSQDDSTKDDEQHNQDDHQTTSETAFLTEHKTTTLFIDSGASSHFFNDRSTFTTYTKKTRQRNRSGRQELEPHLRND
jgi:hypothetical protein